MRTLRCCVLALIAVALAAGEVALTPLIGHRHSVSAIAAAPDGVVATWDGELRLWDAGSGRLLWLRPLVLPLAALGNPVLFVGGDRVVFGMGRFTAVFDRSDGRELARAPIRTLAVSADGAWLIHATADGVGWRTVERPGEAVGRITGPIKPLAAFDATATHAWVCAADGTHLTELQRDGQTWHATPRPDVLDGQVVGLAAMTLSDGGEALAVATLGDDAKDPAGIAIFGLPLAAGAPPLAAGALQIRPRDGHALALLSAGTGRLLAASEQREFDEIEVDPLADEPLRVRTGGSGRPAWLGGPQASAWRDVVTISLAGATTASLGSEGFCGRTASLLRSPDGRLLWASRPEGLLCWDLALLQLRSVLPGHLSRPLSPTTHPRFAMYETDNDDGSDGPWRLLDLLGRNDLASVLSAATAQPAVAASGSCAVTLDDGRVHAWLLPSGGPLASAALPAWDHGTQRTVLGISGDGARALVARAGWRDDGYAGEDKDAPQVWDLRVYALPAMTAERSATLTQSIAVGGATPVRILGDGDGWILSLPHGAVRLGPGAAERGDSDATTSDADVAPPLAAAGATDGPWFARIPAALDVRGLVQLGGGPSRVNLISNGGAWAAWSDDGVFDGSRDAARLLAAALDQRPSTLDEVAPWANRPDRLLRLLGCDDAALLAAAAKPADRRHTPAGTRPAVQVANRSIDADRLVLDLRAAQAQRIACRWDGVPAPDVAVADGRATVVVPLGQGVASLELAAIDTAGQIGPRISEPVPSVRTGTGRLVVACIGVSRYRQERLTLRFAAKDAIDLALAFGDDGAQHAVRTWIDEQVVPDALDAIRAHLAQAGPADTVILSLAGHGLYVADPSPVWRFLPWDADAERPAATGIAWPRIAALFDGCAARRRFIILDTCESGALEDDRIPAAGLAVAGARGLRGTLVRSLQDGLAQEFAAGDRSRYVTADLATGIGAVVLASSRGGEASYESEADRNGLFTAALLAGLRGGADADRDGAVSADELLRWTIDEVARRSGGLQHPTIDRDNPAAGIRLPVLPALE
jgi:uncharacterized caspase-like protein